MWKRICFFLLIGTTSRPTNVRVLRALNKTQIGVSTFNITKKVDSVPGKARGRTGSVRAIQAAGLLIGIKVVHAEELWTGSVLGWEGR